MTEPCMPTTLPSPVDRKEFRFVAIDAEGTEWQWVDNEMVWVRLPGEPAAGERYIRGREALH